MLRKIYEFWTERRKFIVPLPGIIAMVLLQFGIIDAEQNAALNDAFLKVSQTTETLIAVIASIWIPAGIYLPTNDKPSA